MKILALLSIWLALPLRAQTEAYKQEPPGAARVKTEPSINQLKLQVSNLALQNAQLSARIDGLQKELETTRNQLIQLQTNAVVSELCSAAGFAPKDCSVAQDGSVSKVIPPAPRPPEEPAKPAAPSKP